MLLQLENHHVLNTGARGEVDGKKVNFFMVINVDEESFPLALEKYNNTKGVVAFNFTGNPAFLQTTPLLGQSQKPVLHHVKFTPNPNGSAIDVQQIMIQYPQTVRVVLDLPDDYNDMRFIHGESLKYPNIRFEGGKLLRLAGCKIGAIEQQDISKKIAANRIDITPDPTNSSVMGYIHIDYVDSIEFYQFKEAQPKAPKAPRVAKPKTPKAPKAPKTSTTSGKSKPKKQLSNLLELTATAGSLDNF